MDAAHVLNIGPWTVEVDRQLTAAIYAQVASGAEDCPCDHCQDWAAQREELYPPPVRELLASLGIDYRREAQLMDLDSTPESHLCQAWFHFIGRIVSGPMPQRRARGVTRIPDPSPITDDWGVIAMAAGDLMKPAFESAYEAGSPIASLHVHTSGHRMPRP